MAEWVLEVERAYVTAATNARRRAPMIGARSTPTTSIEDDSTRAKALAAIGAVASHYLAVGTPRSLGIVVDAATVGAGALSLEAHRTWFAPVDLRCHGMADSIVEGTRATSLAEALACDIVCIHVPITIASTSVRRGTHLNVLVEMELPAELASVAVISREVPDLGALAAGFVDGRQLDEITVLLAGDAAIAIAALA
jgi:hypothetical protein